MSRSSRVLNSSCSYLLESGVSLTSEQILGDRSSVTERSPLVSRLLSERQLSSYPQDSYIFSDPDFGAVVLECEDAILRGIYPQRIKKGSSGSYFVLSLAEVCFVS